MSATESAPDALSTNTQHDLGAALLTRARQAIAAQLGLPPPAPAPASATVAARLADRGAVFVTLTRHGQLRGCIGSLKPQRALADDVRENAIAAAVRDPRFPPLSADEYADTEVEVSLLSPFEFMDFRDEADCLAQLRPGIDGVILFDGCGRQATFLPQVWEQLPDPTRFMAALKLKAGLKADAWSPRTMVATYSVEKFREASAA